MNSKKIVITGASGFLGSHLVDRMKDDERYAVIALTSHPDKLRERLNGEKVTVLHNEVFTRSQSFEILNKAIVVNCAYPRNSTGSIIADGLRYIQKTFDAAVDNKATGIINISSQSVYSQQRTETATEETPLCLESPYAVGKYATELMLESICKNSSTSYTSLRMASLIGPRFDQRIVNRLIDKIINHESITLTIQDQKLGFMDVEDAASAIMALADTSPTGWKTVYNAGTGSGYTIRQIYDTVVQSLQDIVDIQTPITEQGLCNTSTAVSYDRLHNDTGFIPGITLEESVRRIIASALAEKEKKDQKD